MAGINILQGTTVPEIFQRMDYGSVAESLNLAEAWLQDKTFGLYVNGTFKHASIEGSDVTEVRDPYSGRTIANVIHSQFSDVDAVLKWSQAAQITWRKLDGFEKAKHLYSIARHLQKHASLLVQMESLNRGVQSRDPREFDVPGAIRQFYYYAGWAELNEENDLSANAPGVVAGITSATSSLVALAWIVAPALAAGNVVILKPSKTTPLNAYLLAQICTQAGLPPGVLNVIPGPSQIGKYLASQTVSHITFCGSTVIGRQIVQDTAGMCKNFTMFLSGRTPMLVFDSADIDSAVEGAIDSAWFNQGQVSWAVRNIFVQESIFITFVETLKDRMKQIRIGDTFDKMADVGRLLKTETIVNVTNIVNEARQKGVEVFQVDLPSNLPASSFLPPTLLINSNAESNRVISEDDILPLLSVMPFRTAKEAVMLSNNTRYGMCASVWTEIAALAYDVANKLQVGTVWINSHGIMDAGVPFGGWKQSGLGCFGGKEGLLEYQIPRNMSTVAEPDEINYKTFGASPSLQSQTLSVSLNSNIERDIDSTYKLYYGGMHNTPDSNASRTVIDSDGKVVSTVADGNRKDIRNAVEAAMAVQPGWWKLGAPFRSQILYNIAEKLQARKQEFISNLQSIDQRFSVEVNNSLRLLFHWAASCDKKSLSLGDVVPVSNMVVTASREPLGVIGIIIDDSTCIESFIQQLAAAICYGNSIIIIPNMKNPVPAMLLCQVFDTSDVPKGVLNVLTGDKHVLVSAIAQHQDVKAVWYTGKDKKCIKYLEWASSHNMKRTWIRTSSSKAVSRLMFELNATQSKAIWVPSGEIFSN